MYNDDRGAREAEQLRQEAAQGGILDNIKSPSHPSYPFLRRVVLCLLFIPAFFLGFVLWLCTGSSFDLPVTLLCHWAGLEGY